MKKTLTFARYPEKFVKAVTLYYNSTDSILYYNKENTTYKNAVSKDELKDLFVKNLIVIDDGTNLVRPTAFTASTNYSSVSYITVGDSNIAVLTSFYSDGYSAG